MVTPHPVSMVRWHNRGGPAAVFATLAGMICAGNASRAVFGPRVLSWDNTPNTTNDTLAPTTTRVHTTQTPATTTTLHPSTTIASTTPPPPPTTTTILPTTILPTTTIASVSTTTVPATMSPSTTTTIAPPTTIPTTWSPTTTVPASAIHVDESTTVNPPTQIPTATVQAQADPSAAGGMSGPAMACLVVGGLILVCVAIIAYSRYQRRLSKRRLSDKDDLRITHDDSDNDGLTMIEMTEVSGEQYPFKHYPKSPVPVLSLRHYECDTKSMAKTESIKLSSTSFNMFARHTSDSIDSYRASPHGEMYRNMASPTYSPRTRQSHTLSESLPASPRTSRRTDDFLFSLQFSRGSSMTTPGFGAYPSNLLRNSDDLSVYSDRSDGTNL